MSLITRTVSVDVKQHLTRERETGRQTDRQTETETERQRDRDRDKQTDRQTETDREKPKHADKIIPAHSLIPPPITITLQVNEKLSSTNVTPTLPNTLGSTEQTDDACFNWHQPHKLVRPGPQCQTTVEILQPIRYQLHLRNCQGL